MMMKRSGQNMRYHETTNNVKLQLLQDFSSIEHEPQPVFVFAATNLVQQIDDAFLRRMSRQIKFEMPNRDEVTYFVKKTFGNDTDPNVLEEIIGCSVGISYAFLSSYIKRCSTYDEN